MKSRQFRNRITAVIMAVVMALNALPQPVTEVHAEPGQAEEEKMISGLGAGTITGPETDNDISVWDTVQFGSYPQDRKDWVKQPIKWRILSYDSNSGDALVLADRALDNKPYNKESGYITWKTSTIRSWLNSTGDYEEDETSFFNAAFNDSEKCAIKTSTIENKYLDGYPDYIEQAGENTDDKIFLLSKEEATNEAYGFESTTDNNQKKNAIATAYALENGISSSQNGEAVYLLLRTWGVANDTSGKYSYCRGPSANGGDFVGGIAFSDAIRPAMHIDLKSQYVSDAGKVSSDGNIVEPTAPGYEADGYKAPVINDGVTCWDCVYFGSYYQDAEYEVQPIEWRVLSVSDNGIFLLADKALDCGAYYQSDNDITWEECSLRAWLNGEFANAAFSDAERAGIIVSDIENPDNPESNTEGGNATRDKIFLLSIEEVTEEMYGFASEFQEGKEGRIAKVTDFAICKGAYKNSNGNGDWWLRSPGHSSKAAAAIYNNGSVAAWGYAVYGWQNTIRPALHIDPASLIAVSKLSDKAEGTGAKYKLTTVDEGLGLSIGSASKDGRLISAAYTLTDNSDDSDVTQLSVIVTDGTWTDKGWSKGAALKQYKKAADMTGTSGTLSFNLDESISGEPGKDYHIYLIAEDVNAENETDHASVPIEIQNIVAEADGYEGVYDGKAHGGVTVKDPASGAVIRYGTQEGVYDLESYSVTDATEEPVTIYYQITAPGYFAKTGTITVNISKADTTVTTPAAKEGLTVSDTAQALVR